MTTIVVAPVRPSALSVVYTVSLTQPRRRRHGWSMSLEERWSLRSAAA